MFASPFSSAIGETTFFETELFTVEPELYSSVLGGVRVDDMVRVTETGHKILSPVQESLNWKE